LFQDHVQGPYSDISRVLDGARRRRRAVLAATAAGWGGAALAAAALAGAIGLGIGPGGMAWWLRPVALGLGAAAVLAALAWAGWSLWRTAWGAPEVAVTVAGGDDSLRSALLSAVELDGDRAGLDARGLSTALADEHIARTGERARAVDLSRAVPDRPARRAGLALAAGLAAWGVAASVLGPDLGRGWARLLAGVAPVVGPPRAEPITGDVEITYLYPAYTGRPERKVPGSDGSIQAPRGTEVRLSTRSDRPVKGARVAVEGATPEQRRAVALLVKDRRDLSGSFVVDGPGSYRFQFTDGDQVLVNGPPIPVTVEADAFPEVRIASPAGEVEVAADARVHVEWGASDDFGLGDLTLVVKAPAGDEERRPLRSLAPARRDSGAFELDLAPMRLAEGEKLLYWLEVMDNDTVSGPKRAASATRAAKIYSQAEHHQRLLAEARRHWEEMVRLLGDRLEQLPRGMPPEVTRVSKGLALDGRTRQLHERLREASQAMRKEKAAPRELAAALANVAQGIRDREVMATSARQTLSRHLQFGRPGELLVTRRVDELDDALDRELEKDVLYLESLFDKRRAEDLVRMAKDLASRRRELASLLEKYRQAPSEQAKKQLLAEVSRLRGRMQEMLRQMSELARGVSDAHMNAEAMAELAKGKDVDQGMKRVEELLARGDVDEALRELDAMGSALQDMLSSLERTAGNPDERTAALSRQLRDFQKDLASVEQEQEKVAAETEKVRGEYRKATQERMRRAEPAIRRIEELARKAQEELGRSRAGTAPRSEDDFAQARERLDDLGRALAGRDLDAALDASRRALGPMQRLATGLEDEALMSERFPQLRKRDPEELREAARHASLAVPPARQAREELEKLFPDARTVLPQGEQQKLDRLAREQQALEQQAGRLQQKLEQLSQEAPIFPPQAMQGLGEGRGHMQAAASELGQRNPQRGLGQQREAQAALERVRKGIEEMGRGGGQGGGGFPFPFADAGSRRQEGPEGDPSREKVEIPQADASKAREEFRRDLLEAMKQGTPEPYQGEVKRYYEELVK
jgi:chaperonin cofactor prefoldin